MTEKKIQKWWNERSQWYQEWINETNPKSAHYGPYAPNENKLKLLGYIKGKRILEIGCGAGQCSIAFAKQGAICTGIDISERQLEFAEKLAKKNKVKVHFIHGSFQNLGQIKSGSQDIVFSAFALQYSPNLDQVLKGVYRVLKKSGLLVFSLDHPFFTIMDPKTVKPKRTYYQTGRLIEKGIWPGGSKHIFVMYLRKVSDISNSIVNAGFTIEKIVEPLEIRKNDPWKSEFYPIKLVKMIGPTIIFKARKK